MSWLKTKSAARYLDVSPRTLRSFVSAGELRPAIIRGSYFFDVGKLDLFMKSHVEENSHDSKINQIVDTVMEKMRR